MGDRFKAMQALEIIFGAHKVKYPCNVLFELFFNFDIDPEAQIQSYKGVLVKWFAMCVNSMHKWALGVTFGAQM